jgi:hypothetical protein
MVCGSTDGHWAKKCPTLRRRQQAQHGYAETDTPPDQAANPVPPSDAASHEPDQDVGHCVIFDQDDADANALEEGFCFHAEDFVHDDPELQECSSGLPEFTNRAGGLLLYLRNTRVPEPLDFLPIPDDMCPVIKRLRVPEPLDDLPIPMEFCFQQSRGCNLPWLTNETMYAIIDPGCISTVCGTEWLDAFEKRLGRPLSRHTGRRTVFNFGRDSRKSTTTYVVVPATIGGKSGVIMAWLVVGKTPFLLSRASCKKMGMVLDMENGTATAKVDGQRVACNIKQSSTGHYLLRLG